MHETVAKQRNSCWT